MLLSDISPIQTQPEQLEMETISQLFNGDSKIEKQTQLSRSKHSSITEMYGNDTSSPTSYDLYKVVLVCFLVFISLAIDVPSRLSSDHNKFVLFMVTSLVAGFIFWIFGKKYT
jgi:hypothetical protein